MSESEPRRRRGRPRVSEEERKRHTLTFRMRSDLRDAVEELAAVNSRTLSEQVEYYVDSGVFTEAKRIYEFSTDAMSPVLYRCISSREVRKDEPHLDLNFPPEHREMLTIAGKNHLNTSKTNPIAPKAKEPNSEEDAIDLARALLDGTVRGVFESFEELWGTHIVTALQNDGAIGLSTINIKTNRAFRKLEDRCAKAEAEVDRLKAEIEALNAGVNNPLSVESIEAEFARVLGRPVSHSGSAGAADSASIGERASLLERLRFLVEAHSGEQVGQMVQRPSRMPLPADMPPAKLRGGKGYSIAALRDLVAGFTDREPDLEALRAAGWPALFGGLPASTRTALIGELRDGAPDVYQAVMSPTGSHGSALAALRRLQNVLLPRGEDDGPDEDLGDVEGRQAKARR